MTLTEWARVCSDELGLDLTTEKADVDRILGLARDSAHQVARPAAPLTAYLLGVAVGRGADPVETTAKLAALANLHRREDDDG